MPRKFLLLMASLCIWILPTLAIGENPTPTPTQSTLQPATIVNDEGGAVSISGSLAYTNAYFTLGVSEPLIILEDQTGFVRRQRDYLVNLVSQQMGQITSNFNVSPFTYNLALPAEPQGEFNDVDHDEQSDLGVMVFAIAYWRNLWGDSFLEQRDLSYGGWSSAYASTLVSSLAENEGEYTGGRIIVYAPDNQQAFPSGFGVDKKLFTADDPLVLLPQGYMVVDMSQETFVFDRSRYPKIDLLEGEGASADNFRNLSYTDAFDAMIEKFRKEYAFTEYKRIDWNTLSATFRPDIQTAQQTNDADLFALTLMHFIWQIPDGHVQMPFTAGTFDAFTTATDGGIGMAIRELDDGRVLSTFILADSPADRAGIALKAEIISLNGVPIADAIRQIQPWSAPFSTAHYERLQQLRYATRFPVGDSVTVVYKNPSDTTEKSATLTAVDELDSFTFSSFNSGKSKFDLPVQYKQLPSGYLLVKITSFADDNRLAIQLWERMIQQALAQKVPGIIIDMRQNGGGSGYVADQMAAYFFDEPYSLGSFGRYDEGLGTFYFDPQREEHFILPSTGLRFGGQVAVLVAPSCASACEFFSYDMAINNRATIVGQYPTAGLGGGVEVFYMPDDISIQMTVQRAVDGNGNIHIEGKGVVPTVRVPVDETTLFSDGDPVLDYAVQFLDGQ